MTDYNNLYASVSANPTTFIVNGEHRFQGIFGQGTYRFTGIPIDVTVGVRGGLLASHERQRADDELQQPERGAERQRGERASTRGSA